VSDRCPSCASTRDNPFRVHPGNPSGYKCHDPFHNGLFTCSGECCARAGKPAIASADSSEWLCDCACHPRTESPATPVGGERMSEDSLQNWESKLEVLNDYLAYFVRHIRAERAYATSLERKPLDGYDWRADLERIMQNASRYRESPSEHVAHDRLAAYIESLEADLDALVGAGDRLDAVACNARCYELNIVDRKEAEDASEAFRAARAAIARVKGRAK
jgi:hypothetical protein